MSQPSSIEQTVEAVPVPVPGHPSLFHDSQSVVYCLHVSVAELRKDKREPARRKDVRRYTCDICQVVSSGRVDYEMHLSGKKHRDKAAQERHDSKGQPRVSPFPVANFISRALGTRKKDQSPSTSTMTTTAAVIP